MLRTMRAAHPDTAEVKGYALLSYLHALQTQPRTWSSMLDAMSPEDRQFFEDPVFASQWYPRRHLHALLDALDVVSLGAESEFRRVGERAADFQIHRIHRVFLSFATPALVFRRAGVILSRQSTAGEFRVLEEGDLRLVGELLDADVPPRLPLVIAGWSDRVVQMLRRRPNPTEVSQLAPGRYRFLVSWT